MLKSLERGSGPQEKLKSAHTAGCQEGGQHEATGRRSRQRSDMQHVGKGVSTP